MHDTNSNDGSSRLNELLDEYLNESFKEDENDERSRDQHSIASSSCSKASHSSTTYHVTMTQRKLHSMQQEKCMRKRKGIFVKSRSKKKYLKKKYLDLLNL